MLRAAVMFVYSLLLLGGGAGVVSVVLGLLLGGCFVNCLCCFVHLLCFADVRRV